MHTGAAPVPDLEAATGANELQLHFGRVANALELQGRVKHQEVERSAARRGADQADESAALLDALVVAKLQQLQCEPQCHCGRAHRCGHVVPGRRRHADQVVVTTGSRCESESEHAEKRWPGARKVSCVAGWPASKVDGRTACGAARSDTMTARVDVAAALGLGADQLDEEALRREIEAVEQRLAEVASDGAPGAAAVAAPVHDILAFEQKIEHMNEQRLQEELAKVRTQLNLSEVRGAIEARCGGPSPVRVVVT